MVCEHGHLALPSGTRQFVEEGGGFLGGGWQLTICTTIRYQPRQHLPTTKLLDEPRYFQQNHISTSNGTTAKHDQLSDPPTSLLTRRLLPESNYYPARAASSNGKISIDLLL